MKLFWKRAATFVLCLSTVLIPVTAQAETLSVSQTIVITARVLPTRSIVVNQQGQMIRIYSNTNDAVTPKVYVGDVPGPERPLTPNLLAQYQQVISGHNKLKGVAIQVPIPAQPESQSLSIVLARGLSALFRPQLF